MFLSRDIYYQDPELFLKQSVVDRYVDDIASNFDVKREALNIVSSSSPSIKFFLSKFQFKLAS
jgi:meiotic recombination protein SPO11